MRGTENRRGSFRRRALALILSIALTSVALAVGGQTAGPPVVAVLDHRQAPYRETVAGLRSTYSGPLVEVDVEAADFAAQVAQQNPEVVVAIGQQALRQVRDQVQVPLVYSTVLNPGQYGLNDTRVTGVPLEASPEAQLRLFRQVSPGVQRVAFLYNPGTFTQMATAAIRAGRAVGAEVILMPVTSAGAVRQAVQSREGIEAIWLAPDASILSREVLSFLLLHCFQNRIALFGFLDDLTRAGALASISPDYHDIGARAGTLLNTILARPRQGRTPVPPPSYSGGRLTINLRTAAQLGLSVPASVRNSAAQVFQ